MSTEKKAQVPVITSEVQYREFFKLYRNHYICALFTAKWSEASQQMLDVLNELDREVDHAKVSMCAVEAEAVPDASVQYKVVAVPTTVFVKDGKLIDRIDGVYTTELVQKVQQANAGLLEPVDPTTSELNVRLRNLTNKSKCMLFMKGNPQQPRCGFSNQMINLLNGVNADYDTFDILSDETVRQGLKTYANFPTFPQLYVDGKLVGGLDIAKELQEMGELETTVPVKKSASLSLNEKIERLINHAPVMVFMKGQRDAPQCKFSRALMEMFQQDVPDLKFETFNILADEEIRQGLKEYSKWPTYPQIYVGGKLIGGLDIIKELRETGDLKSALKACAD